MPTIWEVARAVSASKGMSAPASNVMRTLLFLADVQTAVVPPDRTPTLSELAEATSLGRSTVARCLNDLETSKWLERCRPVRSGMRPDDVRTHYALLIPAGESVDGDSPALGPDPEMIPERDQLEQDELPVAGPAVGLATPEGSPAPGPETVPLRDYLPPELVPLRDSTSPAPGLPFLIGHSDQLQNSPTESSSRGRARAKKPTVRATALPADFEVTDDLRTWAADTVPGVNIKWETEKFRDYWNGTGKTKKDWVATWRNWMRTAAERGNGNGNHQSRRVSTTDARVQEHLTLVDQFEQREREAERRRAIGGNT